MPNPNPNPLLAIYNQQIAYVKESGIWVDVGHSMPTVEIGDGHGATLFMQGEEAESFIDSLEAIELECPELDDAELAAAYPYADLLAELEPY